jgi:hypothetical protein
MRRYEVAHLRSDGTVQEFHRLAPAIPAFEDGFAALARGCLLPTDRGTVAIEDILPGDRVRTVSNGFQTVLWRGSIDVVPGKTPRSSAAGRLIRVSADALGVGRPGPDLLLGPAARLHHPTPGFAHVTGHDAAFVPITDFVDGNSVFEVTPPGAVPVYQLGFAGHVRLLVNGVELDSHNPGSLGALGLRTEMLDLYLDLFPQVARLEELGPLLHPRLSLRDIDLFRAA